MFIYLYLNKLASLQVMGKFLHHINKQMGIGESRIKLDLLATTVVLSPDYINKLETCIFDLNILGKELLQLSPNLVFLSSLTIVITFNCYVIIITFIR